MSVNTDYILQNLVEMGIAIVDVRDTRGWSPWHQHGIISGSATYVIPQDRDAFVLTVRHCQDNSINYALIGGGTATSKPREADVLIVTECLNTLSIDTAAEELIVGAGVAIETAEAFVAEHGWTLGQWLGSGATATIGGAVVTNANGILAGRYGNFMDAVTLIEVLDQSGNTSWISPAAYRSLTGAVILGVRLPLWLSPDGRAVARFVGAGDPLAALRQVATARLMPAHISVDQSGTITVIVEGEPHLETARYQLIAAILQKHGAVQDLSLDQGKHWDALLASNPWSANATGDVWADRIVLTVSWSDYSQLLNTWMQRAQSAESELTWRAMNPTPNGVQLILDFQLNGVKTGPNWLYDRDQILMSK
jgi:FAD/FMN-containing dehydrogenase